MVEEDPDEGEYHGLKSSQTTTELFNYLKNDRQSSKRIGTWVSSSFSNISFLL